MHISTSNQQTKDQSIINNNCKDQTDEKLQQSTTNDQNHRTTNKTAVAYNSDTKKWSNKPIIIKLLLSINQTATQLLNNLNSYWVITCSKEDLNLEKEKENLQAPKPHFVRLYSYEAYLI